MGELCSGLLQKEKNSAMITDCKEKINKFLKKKRGK